MAEKQTGSALFYGDAVSATGSTQLYPLGTRREEEGKTYRYVKYDNGSAVAAVSGGLCARVSAAIGSGTWQVTMDISASSVNLCAGVMQSVIGDAEFGWILTKGESALNTPSGTDDIAKGDLLVHSGTDAGLATDTHATNNTQIIGVALADDDDSADTVPAFVDLD